MALSTLRLAMRPCLLAHQTSLVRPSFAMATSAHEQMKEYWAKNQQLGRPNSPWHIYKPHLPMLTSLCHRMTGIAMGVVLYGGAIGLFLAPGDVTSYVAFIKGLEISPLLLMPAKSIVAFPLVYHYVNGIRHLSWDAGKGYELATQYKTGWSIVAATITISCIFGSLSYF